MAKGSALYHPSVKYQQSKWSVLQKTNQVIYVPTAEYISFPTTLILHRSREIKLLPLIAHPPLKTVPQPQT